MERQGVGCRHTEATLPVGLLSEVSKDQRVTCSPGRAGPATAEPDLGPSLIQPSPCLPHQPAGATLTSCFTNPHNANSVLLQPQFPAQPHADNLEEPVVPGAVHLFPSLSHPGLLPFLEASGMPGLQGVTKTHAGATLPLAEIFSIPHTRLCLIPICPSFHIWDFTVTSPEALGTPLHGG